MKKPVRLIMSTILAMGGISALAGCGGDKFDGLTINFWHTFGQTVAGGIETSATEFASLVEKNDGVKLRIKMTYKGGYDDVLGEIGKSFAVGGNPTIAVAYPDHVADYFAAETTPGQYVVNLKPYAESQKYGFGTEAWLGDKAGIEDFVEAFIAESTGYQRQGMYSIPLLKSTEVMLYNVNLVKIAKQLDEGSVWTDDQVKEYMDNLTWEEFMDFCEFIQEHKNEISPTLEVPAFYDSDGNLFITQLFQNEIPYAGINEATGAGYIGFDGKKDGATPEQVQAYADTKAMLKRYKGWYDKGYFTTKGVVGEYSSNYFVPGKTMFAIGSCGGSGYSFPSSAEFTVGSCKVPYNNDNPLYVSQGPTLTVMHNSKMIADGTDEQAVLYAWKFIKYLTNPEVNARQCTTNSEGYIPVRESAYNTATFQAFLNSSTSYVKVTKTVINDVAGNYFFSNVFKGSAELRKQCEGCMADVLKLGKNPSDTAIEGIMDTAIRQAKMKM